MFDPSMKGDYKLPEAEYTFALTPATQQYFYEVCTKVQSSSYDPVIKNGEGGASTAKCWMSDFREYALSAGVNFPVSQADLAATTFGNTTTSGFAGFFAWRLSDWEWRSKSIGWDGSTVRYFSLSFEIDDNANPAIHGNPMEPAAMSKGRKEAVDKLMSKLMVGAPTNAGHVMQTCLNNKWANYVTAEVTAKEATVNVIIGIVVATAVIFLTTRSVMIAVAAGFCIFVSIFSLKGTMVYIGYVVVLSLFCRPQ